jgi:hypothetical protein
MASVEGSLGLTVGKRIPQRGALMVADPRLVIVRRGHFATFELLSRTFADDASVRIIWDRRIGERRRPVVSDATAEGQRRLADRRRRPPTQWAQLNYMIAGTTF